MPILRRARRGEPATRPCGAGPCAHASLVLLSALACAGPPAGPATTPAAPAAPAARAAEPRYTEPPATAGTPLEIGEREPLAAGRPYESAAGFSLLPGSGWWRLPSGTVGDARSTLELLDQRSGSVVVFYVHGGTATIDALVANRRSSLARRGEMQEFQEERHFSSRGGLVPVSTARYGLVADDRRRDVIVVTVQGSERLVEAIALMEGGPAAQQRVRDLLETLLP